MAFVDFEGTVPAAAGLESKGGFALKSFWRGLVIVFPAKVGVHLVSVVPDVGRPFNGDRTRPAESEEFLKRSSLVAELLPVRDILGLTASAGPEVGTSRLYAMLTILHE